MKITLIILQSLDGYLARNQQDDLSWGSKEDKSFFRTKTKEIGAMIMGSSTFANMPDFAFGDRYTIVMSSDPNKFKDRIDKLNEEGNNIEIFASTPEDLVSFLETKGVKHITLIGGGKLNGAFLKADLIDEMYITIAPVLFGNGIRSFDTAEAEPLLSQFKLNEVTQIGDGEVLLHYLKN